MNYKTLIAGIFTSLFISSTCLAAQGKPIYSCQTIEKISRQNNKNSKLNFVNHTMPNYVRNNKTWQEDIEKKFNFINQNYPNRSGLFIFNILNSICKSNPKDYDPVTDPIEDMYFFAVDNAFNALQPK